MAAITQAVYLDTHVVIFLFEAAIECLSERAQHHINRCDLFISPMVKLELEFLYEVKKIRHRSSVILSELLNTVGLYMLPSKFHQVIDCAIDVSWTRDPFDRLIVADAVANGLPLVTKDKTIRKHFKQAIW